MKKLLLAAIITIALSSPARAEFHTGNSLLSLCNSMEITDRFDCLGYTTGVSDAAQWRHFCPPEGITRGQIRDIIVAYLRQNPDVRHKTADILAAIALARVWPCQSNQNRRESNI